MSTEMTSYEVVKYESPKNQVPSKVHRYPVYRRAARKALSPPSPPPPVPAPAPAPAPAPEWSQWERVEGSKWDGWWRARPQEDGGWFYQFTKDGSTIWQQKPVPSETPEPSTASANTAVKPTAKPPPAPTPKKKSPCPPTPPKHQSKGKLPAPPAKKETTGTVSEVPSYTVIKPQPPSPPPPKVKTSITLSEEEEGKHIILDILNLEKPIVIRRISEQ